MSVHELVIKSVASMFKTCMNWLVLWKMFLFFSIYWELSSQLANSYFFRGVAQAPRPSALSWSRWRRSSPTCRGSRSFWWRSCLQVAISGEFLCFSSFFFSEDMNSFSLSTNGVFRRCVSFSGIASRFLHEKKGISRDFPI